MTDSLAPSIFGLIGVLVGSIISTGANFILTVRKEQADAKLEGASLFRVGEWLPAWTRPIPAFRRLGNANCRRLDPRQGQSRPERGPKASLHKGLAVDNNRRPGEGVELISICSPQLSSMTCCQRGYRCQLETATSQLEDRDRQSLFEKAIRILDAELTRAADTVEKLILGGTWPSGVFNTSIPAWEIYEERLAEIESDQVWQSILAADIAAERFNSLISEHADDLDRSATDLDQIVSQGILNAIRKAQKSIASLYQ